MTNRTRREFLKKTLAASYLLPATRTLSAIELFVSDDVKPVRLDASSGFLAVQRDHLKFGSTRSPGGKVISADSQSLLLDGKPWLPVMGEFHFSRFPANEWRAELLKMKSGGIDIVSTYVFWIHHEEVENSFDWSGQRNLRQFINLCAEVGLKAVVRCGPWCHGEVRNGGLPDWILQKGIRVRSDEPSYLERVKRLYGEIAAQIARQLWKDGGPVVGIQLENEYRGPAEHLLTLKGIARDAGMDVPIYTRTGWPELRTRMPDGEIFPLFGAYAEGFWDRELMPMPAKYGDAFLFKLARTDTSIEFVDQNGTRKEGDDVGKYPYFCCEIGGGMVPSYHRRIRIEAGDIESVSFVKLGSGNNLHGYYMYHGGTNPRGKLSTLQESQATKYWNDVPVMSYDFQAPIGEFGQLNPHYHSLRRFHLFLRDFGSSLATTTAFVPSLQPQNSKDTGVLRWAVRTDGESGFIFVNNYQRLQPMPAKAGVQFEIKLKNRTALIPDHAINVPANSSCILPFDLMLGDLHLKYATAQPICRLDDGSSSYFLFSEVEGIAPEFVFEKGDARVEPTGCRVKRENNLLKLYGMKNGLHSFASFVSKGQTVKLLLLSDLESRRIWKTSSKRGERLLFTSAEVTEDEGQLSFKIPASDSLSFSMLPSKTGVSAADRVLRSAKNGEFAQYSLDGRTTRNVLVQLEQRQQAGPAREIKKGSQGVAEAPVDSDFDSAAVWRIKLTPGDPGDEVLLRINYVGDVARIYLDGELLTDNFYNGKPFEFGLNRYQPSVYRGELLLKILPLRRDAPIYLAKDAWPSFKDSVTSIARVDSIELVQKRTTRVELS